VINIHIRAARGGRRGPPTRLQLVIGRRRSHVGQGAVGCPQGAVTVSP
jgi:hypothetical protein